MEADPLHFFGNMIEILLPVDMAEYAVRHMMFFHEGEDVHGLPFLIIWGIVENADDAPRSFFFRKLYAPEKTPFLPAEDDAVIVRKIAGRLRNPAPRSRKGDRPHHNDIIVEKFKSSMGGFRHFCDRVPPVVMIAPDDDFAPWQSSNPQEVGERLFQIASPRQVAGDDHRIFFADRCHPGFINFFSVVFPVFPKYIHGL